MTNTQKPRIFIIYTGGTIGMVENDQDQLVPFDFSHLLENVPKIGKLGFEIGSYAFPEPIDSSNMNPQYWGQIVKVIADNYDKYDGFVVLHGTDTMAYTASALSFMLQNLDKPVVVTGSQLPIGSVRQDGTENIITALEIAAARNPATGEPMLQEVAISFENYLVRGCRSTKVSSTNFRAFKSYNYPHLAIMDLHILFNEPRLLRPAVKRPLDPQYAMDPSVNVLFLYPGITEDVVKAQLSIPGVKAVVLRTFGAGNAPTEQWFLDALKDAISRGVIILNITQCVNGGDEQDRYRTGDLMAEIGVVSGYDMTCEAAVTKLMYLLGKGLPAEDVKHYLATDMVGELSVPVFLDLPE